MLPLLKYSAQFRLSGTGLDPFDGHWFYYEPDRGWFNSAQDETHPLFWISVGNWMATRCPEEIEVRNMTVDDPAGWGNAERALVGTVGITESSYCGSFSYADEAEALARMKAYEPVLELLRQYEGKRT